MHKLQENGLSFNHAYCNSCMCSPSRSTLFTGLYPAQHRVFDTLTEGQAFSDTEVILDPKIPNMARVFKQSGYQTHYIGKWHLSKGTDGNGPSSEELKDYGFDGWTAPDAGEDTKPENFGGGQANHDRRFVNEAIRFLKSASHTQPFLLVVSLVNPHDVLAYPNDWEADYNKNDLKGDIDLPKTVDEDLENNFKPTAHSLLPGRLALRLGALTTPVQKKNYINFYANLLKRVDQEIGRLLEQLYYDDAVNPPLANSTLVIRTADHGEMGMAHGGLRQKAYNVYEETIRVPLVLSHPLFFPQAKTNNALVSLIDLLPTLSDWLKLDSGDFLFRGKSLKKLITQSGVDKVRSSVLFTFDDTRAGNAIVNEPMAAPNRIRCIRTVRYKYARYFHSDANFDEEYELYDLQKDPYELHNLAHPDHPEFETNRKIRLKMDRRLKRAEQKNLSTK